MLLQDMDPLIFPPSGEQGSVATAAPHQSEPEPHCYDLMAANFVMSIIGTICLAAMGNRIGLEFAIGGGGRSGVGWEAGIGIATFTIFFAGVSALICISRNRTLSWVFTVLSMLALFATVIATATSFHEI